MNQIFLDDEQQLQNPDPIRFARGGNPLTAANTLRGGDTVMAVQGVRTQTDASTASNVPATSDPVLYRLRPFNALNAQTPNFLAVNQRPAAPANTGAFGMSTGPNGTYLRHMTRLSHIRFNLMTVGAALAANSAESPIAAEAAPTKMPARPGVSSWRRLNLCLFP